MKHYNRALDYTALALAQLKAGKPVSAARLLNEAAKQKDLTAAIATLEASNAHAFSLQAKRRVKANDDMMMDEEGFEGDPLEEVADVEDDMPEEEFTDEVDDMPEEEPEVAMAKVLSKMVRKAGRK